MPKFDSKISLGNILTIICGLFVAIGWFVSIESANAKRDEKFVYLERRVEKTEALAVDIQTIKVDVGRVQEKQDMMLQILRERR